MSGTMHPDMTPAEREEVRAARRAEQAERDARALAHAAAHPLTEEDRASTARALKGIGSVLA